MKALPKIRLQYFLLLSVFTLVLGNGCANADFSSSQIAAPIVTTSTIQDIKFQPQIRAIPTQKVILLEEKSDLSNNNYYTNTAGNSVHAPAYEKRKNVIPAGASALCRDGTYSFSQSRRGTCSHHGGVADWL